MVLPARLTFRLHLLDRHITKVRHNAVSGSVLARFTVESMHHAF